MPIQGAMEIWGWKGTCGLCFTHALAHILEASKTLIGHQNTGRALSLYLFLLLPYIFLHEKEKPVMFSDI